jgi:tetratricopeptide (TPR) repeat protein
LLVLILHFQILFKADDFINIDVEKLKLESELYKSVTVDEKKVSTSTVPIEEALVVNSARERRTIIMDVLNDNPKEYVEFLQKAGNNEDTEVVHYAVTAMVEISKENDFKLQEFERQLSIDPDDITVLNQYADFLWSCLSQNLMQGQVEVINRELFSSLMQKKSDLEPLDITDFKRAVENDLKLKNFTRASATLKEMKKLYPDKEEYYLSRLDYLASLGRGEDIKALINEIYKRNVFLSSKTKEVLAFWET